MAVDVVVGGVAVHSCADGVGEARDRTDILGVEQCAAVLSGEARALFDLIGDGFEIGVQQEFPFRSGGVRFGR